MKKLIALLAVLVIVFALCACGGTEASHTADVAETDIPLEESADEILRSDSSVDLAKIEPDIAETEIPLEERADEILRSDSWVDLAKIEPDIAFLDGGLVSYNDNVYDWEVNGTTIRITGQYNAGLFMGSSTVNKAYVLAEEAGIPKLSSVTSSSIYVRESELDTALEVLEIPEEIRIKTYDELIENAEEIKVYDLLGDTSDNTTVAAQKHTGKTYIITKGYVSTVYENFILYRPYDRTNGVDTFRMGSVFVYFASDDEMLKVREDDAISVVGVVSEIDGNSVRLRSAYIYND